jgi:hypothetical protein
MKHLSWLLALTASIALVFPLTAQEPPKKTRPKKPEPKPELPKSPVPPYLEFVHGLIAHPAGLSDVAYDYLQSLKNRKDLPPAVAAQLPLEIAKTGVEVARNERDTARRATLYAQAREAFAAFLQANPNSPLAAEATMELGRAITLQGKNQLARARAQDIAANRKAETAKSRPFFDEAAQRLQAAAALIDAQLAKNATPEQITALSRLKLQAEYEQGLCLYEQGKTFDDSDDVLQRGEIFKKAITIFQKVAGKGEKNATATSWMARAWLAGCFYEVQDPTKAKEQIRRILREPAGAADQAKRLASYFNILLLDKDPNIKDPLPLKVKAATDWLKTYPESKNSLEGYAVRFELAESYFAQVAKKPKNQQNTPDSRNMLDDAEKLYGELEKTDSEFAAQAHERNQTILLSRSLGQEKKDLDKIEDFQESFLRARYEITQLAETEKKNPANIKKLRQQHYQNIITALNRAIDLADTKTPAADQVEARYMLTYAYLTTGHPYEAAILGEDLARSDPKQNRAALAGAYALEAYVEILAEAERREMDAKEEGAKDPEAILKNTAADRRRLGSLAQYLEQTWPTHPATDLARHQLGVIALREKKYPDAVAYMSRVTNEYGGYTMAQFQLANAAEQAARSKLQPPAGQPSYLEQAAAALTRIPDLKTRADSGTASIYFYGKLELAKILFSLRQYQQMEAIITALTKQFAENKENLEAEAQKELKGFIEELPLYAAYGKADAEFRAGKFGDALKVISPIADQLKQNQLPEVKDPQLLRGMLGLGLRAAIREGQTGRGQELLALLLEKSAGGLEGASNVLTDLVQQLKGQIEELKAKGPAAKPELEKTMSSFAAFLDSLSRQPERLSPDLLRFVAFSNAGLDRHMEASLLLEKYPEPKADDPEKMAFYRAVRMLYLKELRLSRQYGKAREEIKKILGTWGSKNVDVLGELVQILEDEEKFGVAARQWNELMLKLRPQIEKNAKLRDKYFDCYYHMVYCFYKNAMRLTDQGKKQEYVRKAAGFINTLKKRQPDMGSDVLKKKYDDLLQKEDYLKQQLNELEKGSQ